MKTDSQPIVLLSGPVGAGKTSVARLLSTRSTRPTALIEGDLFWSFLVGPPEKENFRTIMASMIAAALPFARSGRETIVDFSIPPWFVPTARKIAATRDIPVDLVALCPSLSVCESRARTRSDGAITDYASYRELYESFDGLGHHLVEDDEADAATLAQTIRDGLDAREFRLER